MLLCAHSLCAAPKESLWDKAGKAWGGACCLRLSHKAIASGNIPNTLQRSPSDLQPHSPASFYLLSPEAARLTAIAF
jgi:hypothetical protein